MGITSIGCLHATHVGSVDHKQKASRPPPCGGDTSVTTGAEAVAVGGKHLTTELAPRESFARLACEHGPIMTLWLGSMGTVLISSDKVARDMFKNHDVVLARRKTYEAIKGVLELTGPSSWPSTGPNGGRCGGCAPPSSLSQAGSTPRKVCSKLPYN